MHPHYLIGIAKPYALVSQPNPISPRVSFLRSRDATDDAPFLAVELFAEGEGATIMDQAAAVLAALEAAAMGDVRQGSNLSDPQPPGRFGYHYSRSRMICVARSLKGLRPAIASPPLCYITECNSVGRRQARLQLVRPTTKEMTSVPPAIQAAPLFDPPIGRHNVLYVLLFFANLVL